MYVDVIVNFEINKLLLKIMKIIACMNIINLHIYICSYGDKKLKLLKLFAMKMN